MGQCISGRRAPENPFFTYEHRGKVNAVATLPRDVYYGLRVASASDDRTVQVWPAAGPKPLFTYREHRAPVKALAASPVAGDTRLVSGDERGLIHVWTIEQASEQ